MSTMLNADQGVATKTQKVVKRTTVTKKKPRATQNSDRSYRSLGKPRGRPKTRVTRSATNPALESSNESPELSSVTQPVAERGDARTGVSDAISNRASTTEPSNSLSTADSLFACFSLPGSGTSNTSPTTSRLSETTPAGFEKQDLPPTVEFSNDDWNFDGVQEDNIPLGRAFLEAGNTQRLDDTATVNGLFQAAWDPALSASGHEAIAPTDLQHGFTAARPVPLAPTVVGRPGPSLVSAPTDPFSTPHLPYNNMCRHCFCPDGFQPTFSVGLKTSLQSPGRVAAGSSSMPQYQITPAGIEAQWNLVPLTAFSLVPVNVSNNGNPRSYR